MIRYFFLYFFGFLIVGLGVFAYLNIENKLSQISSANSCEASVTDVALKAPGEFPVDAKLEISANELKVVKICQGQMSRDMIDESGEKYSASVPRTILFLSAGNSTPDIITARITNAEKVREYGVAFEHGALNDLRSIQSPEFGSRFDSLLVEAADLCLGAYSDYRQYEVDFLRLREDIENQATAYLAMDFDIQSPDTQVSLYYKIGSDIFQRDVSKLLSPI